MDSQLGSARRRPSKRVSNNSNKPLAAVEFAPPRPVGALDAPVELGLLRGHDPEVYALASNSSPPSVWIAFTLDGMSSRILPKSSRPFLAVAFRNAWEQVHLATGFTAADEPRKQPDGSPERLPRRPSKSVPSDRIMPMEQRRKASRDLPSIRIWSTRAHSRRPSSAPRCRPARRNRRPCR